MGWLVDFMFGKPSPVEPAAKKQDEWSDEVAEEAPAARAEPKLLPEVNITHVEPYIGQDYAHLEMWVTLENQSPVEVEVTNVNVLGQQTGQARYLRPGESHEIKVYSGAMPTNDSLHEAAVEYKTTADGDYFRADHLLKFTYHEHEGKGYYVPESAQVERPIRDI